MKVRITVSTSGKAQNVGKSNSLILADVSTLEEIIEAMSKEFKDMFPTYQTLDKPQGKSAKTE
jgi:hypothetical protein